MSEWYNADIILAIVLSVFLRYMDSDCPFGIFKLFLCVYADGRTVVYQGRIQDFKLRGALEKLRRVEGGAKIVGVFRVKNHDFTPKNHIFSNFKGGAYRVRPPPPGSAPVYINVVLILEVVIANMYTTDFDKRALWESKCKTGFILIDVRCWQTKPILSNYTLHNYEIETKNLRCSITLYLNCGTLIATICSKLNQTLEYLSKNMHTTHW